MGLLVRRLQSGIRSTELEKNMLAHLKPFLNLVNDSRLMHIVSYNVFKSSSLFHWVFVHEDRKISASMDQYLHHSVDVSWMYWPDSGRGCHFFPSVFPTNNFSELYAHLLMCQLSYLSSSCLLYCTSTRLCKQGTWMWSNLKMPCRE